MEKKLTPLQQRFVAEYAIDLNGTQAAIRAGYSPHSAASTASDLLKKPAIREAVAAITSAALERAGITLDRVVTELGRIGLSDIRKVVRFRSNVLMETFDPDDPDAGPELTTVADVELVDSASLDDAAAAAIAEVSLSGNRSLKVKLHAKGPALAQLMRYFDAARRPAGKAQADVGQPEKPAEAPPPEPRVPSVWDDPPDGGLSN